MRRRSSSRSRVACSGSPVNWPQRALYCDMNGIMFMNFSAMPWASRGGSRSSSIDASTIPPSSATPPEWLPMSMARPRAMLIGNHSGGVALDGGMVLASMLLDLDPPRLAQGMAEKFMNMIPFMSQYSARCGQFTGLPEHATRLLDDERLLMVFPEGARGTAKLYWERYSLVNFGTGFMRLSLATGTPIVPFAFIGGG